MTDAAPIFVEACAPQALIRLELWADPPAAAPLPAVCQACDWTHGRLIWIEPGAWLARAPLADLDAASTALEAIAGNAGAVIDITGGLARFRLTGPGWRELLTVGGVFDVESPAFAPGCTAATVLNHAAIWIDVIAADVADVYCLPSYARELEEGWARAIGRMAAEPANDPGARLWFHGTRADLKPGDLISAGYTSNFGDRKRSAYVYLTATLDAAAWGAELSAADGPGRIYIVEPTGPIEDDPNLTNTRFPGNPTQSYRSRDALRVVGEVSGWDGHSADAVQAMKDGIRGLKPLDE